jgi:hypothetical protein
MPSPLAALSPLDGRYAKSADPLRGYFSEQALIRYRVRIELEWLQALAAERSIKELKSFSPSTLRNFASLVKAFSEADAEHIKNIEAETNHDVKAIELWLKSRLAKNAEAQKALEFIHFACTSEDINNLSYALTAPKARSTTCRPKTPACRLGAKPNSRRQSRTPRPVLRPSKRKQTPAAPPSHRPKRRPLRPMLRSGARKNVRRDSIPNWRARKRSLLRLATPRVYRRH